MEGDQPIYRQIAAQIRSDIVSGTLRSEDQVMSTTQYAAFHRINPATAAKAFQELTDEGLLYKRRGVGMFVSPGAPERLRDERRARFAAEHLAPAADEARRLGLDPEVVVESMRALLRGGSPIKGEPS